MSDELVALRLRAKIERLITQREAMLAANQDRARHDLSQAYPEDVFWKLAAEFKQLEDEA